MEPLEVPDVHQHANGGVNGGSTDHAAKHSHGHMLAANMAHESGNLPFHGNAGAHDKGGNGIAVSGSQLFFSSCVLMINV